MSITKGLDAIEVCQKINYLKTQLMAAIGQRFEFQISVKTDELVVQVDRFQLVLNGLDVFEQIVDLECLAKLVHGVQLVVSWRDGRRG